MENADAYSEIYQRRLAREFNRSRSVVEHKQMITFLRRLYWAWYRADSSKSFCAILHGDRGTEYNLQEATPEVKRWDDHMRLWIETGAASLIKSAAYEEWYSLAIERVRYKHPFSWESFEKEMITPITFPSLTVDQLDRDDTVYAVIKIILPHAAYPLLKKYLRKFPLHEFMLSLTRKEGTILSVNITPANCSLMANQKMKAEFQSIMAELNKKTLEAERQKRENDAVEACENQTFAHSYEAKKVLEMRIAYFKSTLDAVNERVKSVVNSRIAKLNADQATLMNHIRIEGKLVRDRAIAEFRRKWPPIPFDKSGLSAFEEQYNELARIPY